MALALISAIVTMVYGSYAAISRSLDFYGPRMACGERTTLVLRLMARQIRGAYMPSASSTVSPQSSTLSPPPVAFRADGRDLSGTALSFLTTGGLGGKPDRPAPLSRIMYRHDPAHGTLSICSEPYVNGVNAIQPPPWRPILSGVRRVDLQFYDGQRWRPGWDGSNGMTLPQAVKIALTVVDEKDRAHEFRTTVPILCRCASPKQPSTTADRKP